MRLRRALGWSFSQQMGLYLLQFVNLIVIARLLTPAEVGVFVLAVTVNEVLGRLRDMGLVNYLIREERLTETKIRAVFAVSILLSAAIGFALLGLRGPISRFLDTPGVADVLLLVALSAFFFPVEQPAQGLLRRDMRFHTLHHITVSVKFIGVATSIGLAWYGLSYMALAWSMLLQAVLRAGLLGLVERRHLVLGPSLHGWGDVLHFGGWITGSTLAGAAVGQGQKFILGAFISPAAAGLFDRAVRLPAVVRRGLFAPLERVFLPTFSRDLREGQPIGPKVEKLVGVTSGVVWPGFLILALLSQPVVLLLFGENWAEVAALLPWLLLAHSLLALLPQPEMLLIPHGRVRRLCALRTANAVSNLGIALLAVSYGLDIFVMSRALATAIFVVLLWFGLGPFLGIALGRLLRAHARSLFCALATAAPTALVVLGSGEDAPIGLLGPSLIAAPFIWLASLYLVKHPLAEEVSRLTPILWRRVKA